MSSKELTPNEVGEEMDGILSIIPNYAAREVETKSHQKPIPQTGGATQLIREILRVRDMSQADLAKRVGGWTQSNVTSILNNVKGNIGIATLYRIMRALNVEIVLRSMISEEEWIIDYSDEELKKLNYGGGKGEK